MVLESSPVRCARPVRVRLPGPIEEEGPDSTDSVRYVSDIAFGMQSGGGLLD